MAITSEEKHIDINDQMQKERRRFLKRTIYTAPTIIALGGLLKPTKANTADFGGSPSDAAYANDTWSTNP